jgi:hypothetical protein
MEVQMRRKSFLVAAVTGAVIAVVPAGAAFGGEIRGPGSPIGTPVGQTTPTAAPAHTNSICAFSGLNHFHAGEEGELPIRTQSYGQLVAAGLKDFVPSPGVACNGNSGFLSGG